MRTIICLPILVGLAISAVKHSFSILDWRLYRVVLVLVNVCVVSSQYSTVFTLWSMAASLSQAAFLRVVGS